MWKFNLIEKKTTYFAEFLSYFYYTRSIRKLYFGKRKIVSLYKSSSKTKELFDFIFTKLSSGSGEFPRIIEIAFFLLYFLIISENVDDLNVNIDIWVKLSLYLVKSPYNRGLILPQTIYK